MLQKSVSVYLHQIFFWCPGSQSGLDCREKFLHNRVCAEDYSKGSPGAMCYLKHSVP
jgi:hypothetical protein